MISEESRAILDLLNGIKEAAIARLRSKNGLVVTNPDEPGGLIRCVADTVHADCGQDRWSVQINSSAFVGSSRVIRAIVPPGDFPVYRIQFGRRSLKGVQGASLDQYSLLDLLEFGNMIIEARASESSLELSSNGFLLNYTDESGGVFFVDGINMTDRTARISVDMIPRNRKLVFYPQFRAGAKTIAEVI